MSLRVTRERDCAAWAAAARPCFERDPVRATIPLSLVVRPGLSQTEGLELWSVSGESELFALRTPPYPLSLSLGTPELARALGRARAAPQHEAEGALSGVAGPVELAEAFAQSFSEHSGRLRDHVTDMRLYELSRVIPPARPVRGSARVASPRDEPLLTTYFRDFATDAAVPMPSAERLARDAIQSQHMFLWEDQGRVVSAALFREIVCGVTRVSFVFTPRDLRGRGYASAVTAHTSQAALDAGCDKTCLFTDLANPTSNSMYQRLGYEAVADFREIRFG